MLKATIYVEIEGKTEKLSKSFKTESERNDWVMDKLQNYEYTFLIVTEEKEPIPT